MNRQFTVNDIARLIDSVAWEVTGSEQKTIGAQANAAFRRIDSMAAARRVAKAFGIDTEEES